MRGARPQENSVSVTRLPRTGPVSRIVRLLGAVLVAWLVVEWASAGLTWFSRPTTLRNPWVWFVTAAAVYYGLYQTIAIGFGRPWAKRVVVAFAVALGQLIRRLRGASRPEHADVMWCIAGLHRFDEWEARQPWHREH